MASIYEMRRGKKKDKFGWRDFMDLLTTGLGAYSTIKGMGQQDAAQKLAEGRLASDVGWREHQVGMDEAAEREKGYTNMMDMLKGWQDTTTSRRAAKEDVRQFDVREARLSAAGEAQAARDALSAQVAGQRLEAGQRELVQGGQEGIWEQFPTSVPISGEGGPAYRPVNDFYFQPQEQAGGVDMYKMEDDIQAEMRQRMPSEQEFFRAKATQIYPEEMTYDGLYAQIRQEAEQRIGQRYGLGSGGGAGPDGLDPRAAVQALLEERGITLPDQQSFDQLVNKYTLDGPNGVRQWLAIKFGE